MTEVQQINLIGYNNYASSLNYRKHLSIAKMLEIASNSFFETISIIIIALFIEDSSIHTKTARPERFIGRRYPNATRIT